MSFDPDKQQEQIDALSPEEFGVLIAREIAAIPSSQSWALVQRAIEIHTGWDAEHEQVQNLVNRIAGWVTE